VMKGWWILTEAFSASVEMIMWFYPWLFIMCCVTFMDLHVLLYPCIPGMQPIWSWCMIFFKCCWILLAVSYWGFLHLCSSGILACNFFFDASLPGLGIRAILVLQNEFGSIPSFYNLWHSLRLISVSSYSLVESSSVGRFFSFCPFFLYNCLNLIACYRSDSVVYVLLVQFW
jgi:hypothetical protein